MVKSNDRFDETQQLRAAKPAAGETPSTTKANSAPTKDAPLQKPVRRRRRVAIRRVTEHPQFYLTAAAPCPYLPHRFERKVFTHLVGERAEALNDLLTQGGFRRSQNIAYRPACEGCRACVSVRVLVDDFEWTRSLKRIAKANANLVRHERPPLPSSEQYSIFRAYLDSRHADGGMADMTVLDYAMMVEDTHVDTRLFEYRQKVRGQTRGPLVAAALTDILCDGLSMVYSYFEPDFAAESLGTYMILDHIRRAAELDLPYVYLGYWVHGSDKMAYKSRFRPQEHLGPKGWQPAEF